MNSYGLYTAIGMFSFSIPQHAELNSMSSLEQSFITIKLLYFKLFFSKLYWYMYMLYSITITKLSF